MRNVYTFGYVTRLRTIYRIPHGYPASILKYPVTGRRFTKKAGPTSVDPAYMSAIWLKQSAGDAPAWKLLQGTGAPASLELLLGGLGVLLLGTLDDGLRSVLDDLLGLLQAEGGELTDDLDDLDLVVAEALEHDVKLGLLLGLLSGGDRAGHDGGRSSGGNAEGVLDSLDELGSLEQGHFLQSLDDLIGGKLSHF